MYLIIRSLLLMLPPEASPHTAGAMGFYFHTARHGAGKDRREREGETKHEQMCATLQCLF